MSMWHVYGFTNLRLVEIKAYLTSEDGKEDMKTDPRLKSMPTMISIYEARNEGETHFLMTMRVGVTRSYYIIVFIIIIPLEFQLLLKLRNLLHHFPQTIP